MPDDLNDLNQKLASFRAQEKKPASTTPSADAENMNTGMRAGSEFIVSIIAGGAIGWAIDLWLHTRPWGLIVFLFLGVGAGFMAIYRITNNMSSAVGFAALQKPPKTDIKPPENAGNGDA